MSKDKGMLRGEEAEEVSSQDKSSKGKEFVENPLAEEEFTNRLIFSSTTENERKLLIHSRDYQLIKSLHGKIEESRDLTFAQMKQKALNIIDDKFETYRKVFDLPTEQVSLPVRCKDGIYYLSVNPRGYLCFYKNIKEPVNKRLALFLVRSDTDAKKRLKN